MLHGMQTRPRAQRIMKLIASGVTHSAASVRSPSFSRSSSSTTSTISPRRMRRSASSMEVRDTGTVLQLMSSGVGSAESSTRPGDGCDHAAAVRLVARHADVAAVQLDDPTRDREPETGAAVARRAGGVGAVETFEDPGRPRCRGCPGPSSETSSRAPPSGAATARTTHRALRRRVPHRVLDEVRDDLVQALGVGLEPEVAGHDLDVEVHVGRVQLRLADRVLEHRARRRTGCGRAAACPTRAARGRAAAARAGRAARPARASCAASRGRPGRRRRRGSRARPAAR